MNQITTALTAEQIAAVEAKKPQPAVAPIVEAAQAATAAPKSVAVDFAATEGRTKAIKLVWPITVDGAQVEEISIRRLTGRDYKSLATIPAGTDENAYLLALMTGLPTDVVDSLDADDYEAVAGAAKDFLPQGLRTAIEQTSATGAAIAP